METKLTLNVNSRVVERAREYAQEHGVSVSKIVEDYLSKITTSRSEKNRTKTFSKLMKLRGIAGPVPDDFDYKKEIEDYLSKKYGIE
jgi:Family of unknown function (DUF6364)